jgi:cyclophilin family peptidyl-prolyl cis-trans isomerase
MNYSLCDLPDSGKNPVVYMDITLKGETLGRLLIRLYRDVFPAGVENFVRIASGKTYRTEKKGFGKYTYTKEIRRTYEGCKFYSFSYNNYIISGDIYNNNGTNAGTIYCDEPISPCLGDYFYPHDMKGLVSLVPFTNEQTGEIFYDSTFLITLDDIKPSNNLIELNCDHIVIGQVYCGIDIITKMNELIFPFAGRKYPDFIIGKCDVYRLATSSRRLRPDPTPKNKSTDKTTYMVPHNSVYPQTYQSTNVSNNNCKECKEEHCGEPICNCNANSNTI